jgi:hypothetical protein
VSELTGEGRHAIAALIADGLIDGSSAVRGASSSPAADGCWRMPWCAPSPPEPIAVILALDDPECQQGGAMVSERGLQVLRAIVQDYVDTHEPVGSKAIVERHQFGVSAATIRNDMALLEDEELIAAPHTSSGRVPTDKGYRVRRPSRRACGRCPRRSARRSRRSSATRATSTSS